MAVEEEVCALFFFSPDSLSRSARESLREGGGVGELSSYHGNAAVTADLLCGVASVLYCRSTACSSEESAGVEAASID